MTNRYRGEVPFAIAGHTYYLRPDFQILCRMEGKLKRPIATLACELATRGMLVHELITILTVATQHADSDRLEDEMLFALPMAVWNEAKPEQAVANFFASALPLLEWDVLQEAAFSVLKLSPQQFWKMTMPEFKALYRAARREQRANLSRSLSHAELAELYAQFPDAA